MLGSLQDSLQRFIRFLTSLVGNALAYVVAGVVTGTIILSGLYTMALLAWLLFLTIASFFGYESQSVLRERQEMHAFIAAYQIAFCRTERIPLAYCDKAFSDSAAYHAASHAWVQIQMARDKKRQEDAPLWGLFETFRDPLVKR